MVGFSVFLEARPYISFSDFVQWRSGALHLHDGVDRRFRSSPAAAGSLVAVHLALFIARCWHSIPFSGADIGNLTATLAPLQFRTGLSVCRALGIPPRAVDAGPDAVANLHRDIAYSANTIAKQGDPQNLVSS